MKQNINFSYLIFLSVVAAIGGFLFGYDTAVISGTTSQVTQIFGLDTLQQGWYVGCALIGSILGVLSSGVLSDRLGRKVTMILSAVMFSVSAIGCAFCADFNQLVIYRIIGGIGIGGISSLYIRSCCSPVSWTLGLIVSVGGYGRFSWRLSDELSVVGLV